ncbi:hypothetical protein TNCV_2505071 [Trichonephila clavipes]|uniref:Uncharacterized protein n=1 Tax=Trichonephila clavipes TaxID=2585209 RepID=A0A8X7BL23_TRICX|nr:hypothetical protein TNCV_2505071 [Trichonephila clavipes]
MSLSPVPLKTRRLGKRCTLNLRRVRTSSHWCGVRELVNINVAMFSYSRGFGDRPRNLEPWSSDEDDT